MYVSRQTSMSAHRKGLGGPSNYWVGIPDQERVGWGWEGVEGRLSFITVYIFLQFEFCQEYIHELLLKCRIVFCNLEKRSTFRSVFFWKSLLLEVERTAPRCPVLLSVVLFLFPFSILYFLKDTLGWKVYALPNISYFYNGIQIFRSSSAWTRNQTMILSSHLGCGTGAGSSSRQKWWCLCAVGKLNRLLGEVLPQDCVL